MTNPTPELSERDRRTLELADAYADAAASATIHNHREHKDERAALVAYLHGSIEPGQYVQGYEDGANAVRAHLAAPQPPSSPATEPVTSCDDDDSPWLVCKTCAAAGQCARRAPAAEQREGEPALRAAAQQLLDAVTEDGESFFDIECDNLRRALAAPSPAVDAGVERDAARYRALRDGEDESVINSIYPFSLWERTHWLKRGDELDAFADAALSAMKEPR